MKRWLANRRSTADLPVTFIPVERAFSPQIKVRALKDVSGWVDHKRRVKWSLGAGQVGCLDAAKAHEYEIKGYVQIIEGEVKPVSENEAGDS